MIRLDVGCGGRGSRQEGFIGIDIYPLPPGKTEEEYKRLDITRDPLPWQPYSVDEAIALHIIEHLTLEEGQIMIQRVVDLLKPGAELVITCPDLRLLAGAYAQGDWEFLSKKHKRTQVEIWRGDTLADKLNWAIHQEGHKWSYDQESLLYHTKRALGGTNLVIPLPLDNKYWTRRDHETGILITKV